MAKSEDFPGKPRSFPSKIAGVKPPAEVAEANLSVPISEILAAQRAQEKQSEVPIQPIAPNRSAITQEEKSPLDNELGAIAEIPVEAIRESPFQPRLTFSDTAIEDLANSIQSMGLVKPLTVRPIGNGVYELIGGERRWRAHQLLRRQTVTAYIRNVSDAMARVLTLTDNEGQETLTEYERGRSYASILESGDEPSIRALARRIGVNHSIVSRCLLLMELPESIREILDTHPGLIGGKWAKEFIEFSRTAPDLLLEAVVSMRDDNISQEQALRRVAKEVAARNKNEALSRFTDKTISGLGTVRVAGKKMEFRCEKNVNPQRLAEQFEVFLSTIDRSLITNE